MNTPFYVAISEAEMTVHSPMLIGCIDVKPLRYRYRGYSKLKNE